VLLGDRERLGHQAVAETVEAGLGAGPAADAQRPVHDGGQRRPELPRAPGAGVGAPDLPQDLCLAQGHGVQAGHDAEQVLDRGAVVVGVHVLAELGEVGPVPRARAADTAATPGWNRSTSTYTSTRLQVETTIASLT
jgi:hypothetical protein